VRSATGAFLARGIYTSVQEMTRFDKPILPFEARRFRPDLPTGWLNEIEPALSAAQHVQMDGPGPGARPPLGDRVPVGLNHRLIAGDVVGVLCPQMFGWFHAPETASAMSAVLGRPVRASRKLRTSININHLKPGHYCEWHVDSAGPYICVLFVTTHPTGAEFLWRDQDGQVTSEPARSGEAVVLNSVETPHAVGPFNDLEADRITIPMVFVPLDSDKDESDVGHENVIYDGESATGFGTAS
jgi:hypothetical protein